jgi:hypothetical protein
VSCFRHTRPPVSGRLWHTSLATFIFEVSDRHMPIDRNDSVDAEFKE